MTNETASRLPDYLKSYVVDQNYERYTPREQATWRCIMRQARRFFTEHAHPIYLEGLKATGIPISKIPSVTEMDKVLNKFGWGAVCVNGFIPPATFLDFQSRRVLPIAADMRTLEHIGYTPAPDIVHEAAGHAPIIADPNYASYLQRYARLAHKAIFSNEDVKLYESIRLLSDLKENPDASQKQIDDAEENLKATVNAMTWVTEAQEVARMNWWTAEYGLVGDVSEPAIYGAGLLSSIGEGHSCLLSDVKKIPLSLECVRQTYDITRPQPQLFVARDFEHLTEVLIELEETMAFMNGGITSLVKAKKAKTVTTTVLDTGLAISGQLVGFETNGDDVAWLEWSGKLQVSVNGKQVEGFGPKTLGDSLRTPLGRWEVFPDCDPQRLSREDLDAKEIKKNTQVEIKFVSGAAVKGKLRDVIWAGDQLKALVWDRPTVSSPTAESTTYDSDKFLTPIATHVPSVHGGPADWQGFGDYNIGRASTSPGRQSSFTADEQKSFELYQRIRALRERHVDGGELASELDLLTETILQDHPKEWLAALEVIEMGTRVNSTGAEDTPWYKKLGKGPLDQSKLSSAEVAFVQRGLELAATPD